MHGAIENKKTRSRIECSELREDIYLERKGKQEKVCVEQYLHDSFLTSSAFKGCSQRLNNYIKDRGTHDHSPFWNHRYPCGAFLFAHFGGCWKNSCSHHYNDHPDQKHRILLQPCKYIIDMVAIIFFVLALFGFFSVFTWLSALWLLQKGIMSVVMAK